MPVSIFVEANFALQEVEFKIYNHESCIFVQIDISIKSFDGITRKNHVLKISVSDWLPLLPIRRGMELDMEHYMDKYVNSPYVYNPGMPSEC